MNWPSSNARSMPRASVSFGHRADPSTRYAGGLLNLPRRAVATPRRAARTIATMPGPIRSDDTLQRVEPQCRRCPATPRTSRGRGWRGPALWLKPGTVKRSSDESRQFAGGQNIGFEGGKRCAGICPRAKLLPLAARRYNVEPAAGFGEAHAGDCFCGFAVSVNVDARACHDLFSV